MPDLYSLLAKFVFSLALSVVLAAFSWALMSRLNNGDDDSKAFFSGTFYGGLKLFTIYLVLLPALEIAGFSPPVSQFLHVLLVELSILLAIQLFSYILTHLVRAHREALALGIIGGITRSEAVSGSLAALVKEDPALVDTAAVVIITANTTMLARTLLLLLLIPVVGVPLFFEVLPAVLGMFLVSLAVIYYTYNNGKMLDLKLSPISVSMAVQIILAFAVVSALATFAGAYGNLGYYAIAALGALGGALPVVLSVIAILAYKSLSIPVAANIVLIAVTVGYVNDSVVALMFKQKDLFRKLADKYLFVLLGGLVGFVLGRHLVDLSFLPSYSPLLFFLLFFIPSFAWLLLKKRDPLLAGTIAWGLFGALVNVILVLVVIPIVPSSWLGIDVHKLTYLLVAVVSLEVLLFLYTRLGKVTSLTALGFVAGIVSSESLTFNLSKQDPPAASGAVFAAKSAMYLRNLAVLFVISVALASKVAVLFLLLSVVFLALSRNVRVEASFGVRTASPLSMALLLLLLVFAGLVSKLALAYLGVYGLYAAAVLLSFAGLLPPMLATVALFISGSITAAAAVSLISVSALAASVNDVVLARMLKARELSSFLLRKELVALAVGAIVFYLVSLLQKV